MMPIQYSVAEWSATSSSSPERPFSRDDELGVVGPLLDRAVVLLHAGAGPRIEIEGRHVDEPALDLVGRAHRVGQRQRLAREVVVGDACQSYSMSTELKPDWSRSRPECGPRRRPWRSRAPAG